MSPEELVQRIACLSPQEQEECLWAVRNLYGDARRVMAKPPTIIEALDDPNLLGGVPEFRELKSWEPWLTFLSGMYGLPMGPRNVERFLHHTGRTKYEPPPGGYKEVVLIVGVQSGKSRICSAVSVYEGAIAWLSQKNTSVANIESLLLAQDLRGASKTMFGYVESFFLHSETLRGRVLHKTTTSITLDNGLKISVYPTRPSSIRGLRSPCIILDEFAFYIGTEASATDKEMLTAARGRLATTNGRLIIASSPGGEDGELWRLVKNNWGRDDSPILVWKATAPEMNPTLSKDYLEKQRLVDPVAYRAEVLGEFREGIAPALDPKRVDECRKVGRHELAPRSVHGYVAFVDPSGGRADSFTLAIGHREHGVNVVDAVREWKPPFNPSDVVYEACVLLQQYGVDSVEGDKYGGEWPAEQFRRNGVDYLECPVPKSDLYISMIATTNAVGIELLDNEELIRQLKNLQRHMSGGRDKIDHRPGSHDDVANAVAGLNRSLCVRVMPEFGMASGDSLVVGMPPGAGRPELPWEISSDEEGEEDELSLGRGRYNESLYGRRGR